MENIYTEQLKNNGLKNTPQRIAILDILFIEEQPISVDDIYIKLKEKNISINLSTVYRSIEAMEEKKIISKLDFLNEGKAYYEYNKAGHRHYLICKGCKKITTIYSCPLELYEKTLEQNTNYKIDEHKLCLYGYCPNCNKNK